MSSSELEILKNFRKNTEWFDNNYNSLNEYDGQFIAIHSEHIVDTDKDYRKLVNRIKNLHDKSLYVTLVTRRGTVSAK
jgi:hypothetical protein